jgi:site-specific DNA-methyltransferase (adenine-specific)
MENMIFELNVEEIKVHEELPRVRKDLNKIEELAASMEKYGQMQPIVLNRNYELIAGGRRLAACTLAGRKPRCIFSDTIDPLIMREMELEENLQRESLTPAEEVLAVEEIHKLKQRIYGETVSGHKGGWSLDKTAAQIGKTRGSVIDDLQLAEMVHMFPEEMGKAKTKSEIRKVAKALNKVMTHVTGLRDYEAQIKSGNGSKFDISRADAKEHMLTIEDGSIDLLLTDPPWGIDIDKNRLGVGGVTGNVSTTGTTYEDGKEMALDYYSILGKESIRFCTPGAHVYLFCAPEHFWLIRAIWQAHGWIVSPRPIVWIKNGSGQNNAPHAWPSAAYEFILFARRIDSRLVIEGRPDWIQVAPVNPSERIHDSEKPIDLLKELIERAAFPSQRLYDPFMGSGASIEAALNYRMFPIACDNSEDAYAAVVGRIAQWENKNRR